MARLSALLENCNEAPPQQPSAIRFEALAATSAEVGNKDVALLSFSKWTFFQVSTQAT